MEQLSSTLNQLSLASQTCTVCTQLKSADEFHKNYKQCKTCVNKMHRKKYDERKNSERVCTICQETIPTSFIKRKDRVCMNCHYERTHPDGLKVCNTCSETKHMSNFVKHRMICQECKVERDKKRYQRFKNEEGTRVCTVCKEDKDCKMYSPGKKYCMTCLNAKECKDRNSNPELKVKKNVRNRIYALLNDKAKNLKSVEYLGCNTEDYLKWLKFSNSEYFFHGNVWHIDHVIPLARFDLTKPEQQMLAFNWRNTMPLLREDNMSKKAKIDKKQIASHYKKLQEYHTQQETEIPQEYVELFATHLDAGTPLEPPTTTHAAERPQ
tara:strand:- start:33 stop:1004 length:972 start_codon:yes stop_codon:yes gene_type:complete